MTDVLNELRLEEGCPDSFVASYFQSFSAFLHAALEQNLDTLARLSLLLDISASAKPAGYLAGSAFQWQRSGQMPSKNIIARRNRCEIS